MEQCYSDNSEKVVLKIALGTVGFLFAYFITSQKAPVGDLFALLLGTVAFLTLVSGVFVWELGVFISSNIKLFNSDINKSELEFFIKAVLHAIPAATTTIGSVMLAAWLWN
ncbi:hypothetical protein [Vibrio cholerae]|uniref:hypothetical protein n=1 Tax=Vibrio cholerae TaxID=666 RepID=UPI0006813C24|nr:hypothetical protein [Vibrio cholerae]